MLCFSLVHVIPGYGERLCWTDSVNTYTFKVTGARAGYVSKSVRTHHSALLNSKEFLCRSKYRIKQWQNATLPSFISKCFLQFQIVSNIVRMHHVPSIFFFLQFQKPPKCTIYRPCFQMFLCSSKSPPIA